QRLHDVHRAVDAQRELLGDVVQRYLTHGHSSLVHPVTTRSVGLPLPTWGEGGGEGVTSIERSVTPSPQPSPLTGRGSRPSERRQCALLPLFHSHYFPSRASASWRMEGSISLLMSPGLASWPSAIICSCSQTRFSTRIDMSGSTTPGFTPSSYM